MKLLIECAVEGSVALSEPIDISVGEFEYHFEPDREGLLSKVSVMVQVTHPERFQSSVEPATGTISWIVSASIDEELFSAAVRKLQALESHISFRLPVKRIRWDSPHYKLVFETEEERESQGVYSLHVDYAGAKLQRKTATRGALGKSIFACDRFAAMTTPLAFVREGNNEYHELRFINAFYNFYFVLEGLYGGGNWRSQAVAESFAASRVFKTAVDSACKALEKNWPKIYREVLAGMGVGTGSVDAESAARYLVKTRGQLHHFANRSEKEPTPFSHDRFKAHAYFVRVVAIFAVTEEMQEVIRSERAKGEESPVKIG